LTVVVCGWLYMRYCFRSFDCLVRCSLVKGEIRKLADCIMIHLNAAWSGELVASSFGKYRPGPKAFGCVFASSLCRLWERRATRRRRFLLRYHSRARTRRFLVWRRCQTYMESNHVRRSGPPMGMQAPSLSEYLIASAQVKESGPERH